MQQTVPSANFEATRPLSSPQEILRAQEPSSLKWAYRLFWLTFILFFASTGLGKLWDRFWHLTNRFETFWSPPHLFVFLMTATTGLLVAFIAFTPRLRIWFGPTARLPILRWHMAVTLVYLGAGLIILTITIMLDNLWHSNFGLDETQWSLPHDLLAWDWFVIITGFIAARMAFHRYRPINWLSKLVIAILILEFMCPALLQVFYLNYTPDQLRAIAASPIMLIQPSAQHLYRIYLRFGISRQTHFLFIPVVSLLAGMLLSFLRRLDRRASIFLLAPFLWSIGTAVRDLLTLLFLHYHGAQHVRDLLPIMLHEPAVWMPMPFFLAALTFVILQRTGLSERWAYALTGLLFATCTFAIWHSTPWMALLILPAILATVLGSSCGTWLYDMLEQPSLTKVFKFLLLSCAEIPAVFGVIDLILRRLTP